MRLSVLLLSIITILPLYSQEFDYPIAQESDTLKYNIVQGAVITTPKETYVLKQVPSSVSILEKFYITGSGIRSLKDVSYEIPNLYIPQYGSKLTSAVYIRGIGSRFSPSPSIGLYSDNVPYLDKSSFDFEFLDIERVEVLRGPQGTLYGRNALGGIIHIRSRSPFAARKSTLDLSVGTYGQFKGAFATNHHLGSIAAISFSGFFSHQDGFFKNMHNGHFSDNGNWGGGKIRLGVKLSPLWTMELANHTEKSNQNAYPYGTHNRAIKSTSLPNYNDTCSYKRLLSTNSMHLTYNAPKWKLSLISSYQHMNDVLRLDQDFTPESVYTMYQKQNQNNYTQEAVFKSENDKNYQFVSGVSGFYQDNATAAPVEFGSDGMKRFFQNTFDMLFQTGQMPFHMKVKDNSLKVEGIFDQQSYGFALFHQTTLRRVFTEGLSLTIGLRYEYERQKLLYTNSTLLNLTFTRPPAPQPIPVALPANIQGEDSQFFGQLLPKIALQYEFSENNKLFITSARGYKSGGYNIQMFSDLIQTKLMSSMPASGGEGESQNSVSDKISYKPEYNWNTEIGFSGLLLNNLQINSSVFYIKSKDQQIVQFAGTTGFGRVARNAASSYSAGAELSFNYKISEAFKTSLNWGYTHSKFIEYSDGREEYKGRYVPFAPKNTLSADITYNREINRNYVKSYRTTLQYSGAGKIYWTEKNDVCQSYYSTLNAYLSINFYNFEIYTYLRNITGSRYNTFYFETLGRGVAQLNNPTNLMVGVKFDF